MGRFDFQGGGFGAGIRDYFEQKELREAAARLEAERAKRMQMDEARERRAAANEQADNQRADDEHKIRVAAAKMTLDKQERMNAQDAVAQAGVGGAMVGPEAEAAKRLLPGMVDVDPGRLASRSLPMTTAAPTLDPNAAPVEAPQVEATQSEARDETVTSKGTRRQQLMKKIADTPDMSDRELMLSILDASGDDNIPASAASMLSTADKTTQVFQYSKTGVLEKQDEKGEWVPHIGNLPENHKILNEPKAPGAGAGGTPYFTPVTGGLGTTPFNTRTGQFLNPATGQWEQGVIPLRPTGGQGQQMADNAAALAQITMLKEGFDPAWMGPVAGRVNTMYTRLANDPDKKKLATYQTRVAGMKNRFIKAITGAQMSEPEAKRIMNQLPDMNLPPTTFLARLDVAEQELNTILEIQQQVFSGQRRQSDNPVTESQLSKLFPDSAFTGKGSGTTDEGSSRSQAQKDKVSGKTATPKTAAELIKQYGGN